MTAGTILSQGTELFTVDALSSSVAAVLKLACPTGISGLGGAKDQVEDTCLDNKEDKTFKPGLGNPGQLSVPFNFIPSHASHQILFELKELGSVLQWMECFSEGNDPPTLDTQDELVAPAGRTTAQFDAYVADVTIDVATNDLVRGTLILQRSGPVVWHWNGPTP
ncbi:phage tail tube protein [Lysobacter sp. Root96]|uniref:phage tail tube protein n=1 Tax=Lysobacter sp. Root96 TaxID=1736612 RepID=UPI0006F45D10|nr:phage tail tube protein [Lysobacter sp. Root96]KRD71449.1 hypothetical protein ASE45_06470 [Lysobacter sp. Root96]